MDRNVSIKTRGWQRDKSEKKATVGPFPLHTCVCTRLHTHMHAHTHLEPMVFPVRRCWYLCCFVLLDWQCWSWVFSCQQASNTTRMQLVTPVTGRTVCATHRSRTDYDLWRLFSSSSRHGIFQDYESFPAGREFPAQSDIGFFLNWNHTVSGLQH